MRSHWLPNAEKQLFVESIAVHFVVRRYAALASSMLALMAEYDDEETGEPGNQAPVHPCLL